MPNIAEALAALTDLPFPLVLVVAGAFTLAECTFGLGFLVPGETALLVTAASVDSIGAYVVMTLLVAVCAVAGDTIGYAVGRRWGYRLRDSRVVARVGRGHWDRAARLLYRYGAWAVVVARFLPVVRTLTPAAAGASQLEFLRFLPAAAVGALGWSSLHVGVGAAAGAAARTIEEVLGQASWFVLGAAVLVVLVTVLIRRRRAATKQPEPPEESDKEPAEPVPQ